MASKTILIIDGDDGFARSLGAEAEARGFAALTTGSSADGLELARSHRPDLIVVNVELTPTNGWSVCTRLKKDDELAHIPVILTSSTSTPDTFEKHRRLRTRADEYFLKPYSAGELLRTASALLGIPESAPESSGEDLVIEDESLSLGDFEGQLDDEPFTVSGDEPFSLAKDDPLETFGNDPLDALGGEELEIEPVAADPFGAGDESFDSGVERSGGFGDAFESNADGLGALDELGALDALGEEPLSNDDLSALDGGEEAVFADEGYEHGADPLASGDDAELVSADDLQVFDDAFDQLSGKIPIDGSDGVIEGGEYEGGGFDSGTGGDPLAAFDDNPAAAFDPLSANASDDGDDGLDAPELLSMSDISELSLGDASGMGGGGFTNDGPDDGFGSAEPVEEHQVESIDWEENGAGGFSAGELGADGFDSSAFGSDESGGAAIGDAIGGDGLGNDGFGSEEIDGAFAEERFGEGTFDQGAAEANEASLGFESELDALGGDDPLADPLANALEAAAASADGAASDDGWGLGDGASADAFEAPGESDAGVGSGYGDPAVFAELEARIAELEAELEGYRTSDSGRDQELERLNGELRSRDTELLDSRNQQLEKDRIIHELRETESRLNMELARARDERVRREATVKALAAKAEQMATQARRLEREVARSREIAERLAALEAERNDLNARLAELDATRDERDSLRATVDELTARAEAAEERAKSLDEKLSRTRESILGALGS